MKNDFSKDDMADYIEQALDIKLGHWERFRLEKNLLRKLYRAIIDFTDEKEAQ